MTYKTCKQCGERKLCSADFFRTFKTAGSVGYYGYCLECEKINNRYKYLLRKEHPTEEDIAARKNIEKYYQVLESLGLEPPVFNKAEVIDDLIASKLQRLEAKSEEQLEKYGIEDVSSVPEELLHWLTTELVEEPGYYLDNVLADLYEKYRPIIGVSPESGAVYDQTYAEIIDKIAERFEDHEHNYAW